MAVLGSAKITWACSDHHCDDPGDPTTFFGGPESASCSSITGSFTLGATSNTIMEIGGYVPCTEFDRFSVGGLLTLQTGSKLTIERLNNFFPEPGDAFRIINYGSRTGTFTTLVNHFGIPNMSMGTVYNSDHMNLVFSALMGDTDIDGDVDFADLLTVAQNYEHVPNARWFDGDFNNDLVVNFSDLLVVAQNYGQHLLSSESLLTSTDSSIASAFQSDWASVLSSTNSTLPSAVPEPTSLALLAPLGLMLRRRR